MDKDCLTCALLMSDLELPTLEALSFFVRGLVQLTVFPENTGRVTTITALPENTGRVTTITALPENTGRVTTITALPENTGKVTTITALPENTGSLATIKLAFGWEGCASEITSND